MENNTEKKHSPAMLAFITLIEAIEYSVTDSINGAVARKHNEQKQILINEIKKISDDRDELLQVNLALTKRLLELTKSQSIEG